MRSSGMSAVIACASVGDRIHSSSSNSFVVVNWHSSGISPVAHLTAKISMILKSRLLCPAPTKAMMASRCSCRSPVGRGCTRWCQFDMWERSDVSRIAAGCLVSASAPSRMCRLSSLRARKDECLGQSSEGSRLWSSASDILLTP